MFIYFEVHSCLSRRERERKGCINVRWVWFLGEWKCGTYCGDILDSWGMDEEYTDSLVQIKLSTLIMHHLVAAPRVRDLYDNGTTQCILPTYKIQRRKRLSITHSYAKLKFLFSSLNCWDVWFWLPLYPNLFTAC